MDFGWLKNNSAEQIPFRRRGLRMTGDSYTSKSMPGALVEQLEGVKTGDYRLYAASDSEFHVVQVLDHTPERQEEFDAVKSQIYGTVRTEKTREAIAESAKKMRDARDVKVFITAIDT